MTTMIQDLMMRQAKIGQAIRLLQEAGLSEYVGGDSRSDTFQIAASSGVGRAIPDGRHKRVMSPESRMAIGAKMKQRWAEKKAKGQNMNPRQPFRNPLTGHNVVETLPSPNAVETQSFQDEY